MFFRTVRMVQGVQGVQADVNQLRRELIETVEGLKASLESQRSLWSQFQTQGDRIADTVGEVTHLRDRVENLITRVLQNESITAKLQDDSVRLEAGVVIALRAFLSDGVPDPPTGIRRELCPTD